MGKKGIFLFVALLLPAVIFVFLKMFGKNEFDVEVLFQKEKPEPVAGCSDVTLPYHVSQDVVKELLSNRDSLSLVWFAQHNANTRALTEIGQLKNELAQDPVRVVLVNVGEERYNDWYACRFLMRAPLDAVLIDRRGAIRGQYQLADRDEADRLRTEITILLKKY